MFTVALHFLISYSSRRLEVIGVPPWEVPVISLFPLEIRNLAYYYTFFSLLLVTSFIVYLIFHSTLGLKLIAIREGELGIRVHGINTFRIKVLIFMFSAICWSVVGSIYSHFNGFVSPDSSFDLWISLRPVVYTMFGGLYTFIGPILGCSILLTIDRLLLTPMLPGFSPFLYGTILITMTLRQVFHKTT